MSSVQFNCFTDEAPCDGFEYGDSTPCSGEISSILSPDAGTKDLTVELCNSHAESTSAVWEIDFSSSYDYGKMDLTFTDEGRTRIVGTQDTPDFNTQLSMVSVVGERHVGKSTILSLLSGNATMFQVHTFINWSQSTL